MTGESLTKLAEKVKTKVKWRLDGDANRMWEEMAECIQRSARDVLGVSERGTGRMRGSWWWSEEVKVMVKLKEKQEKYNALVGSGMDEEKEPNRIQYGITKKEAKNAVAVAKNNAYERLYQRLNSKEGENEVFKLSRVRERRIRDLSCVRCIEDEDGKVLVEDNKVQEH